MKVIDPRNENMICKFLSDIKPVSALKGIGVSGMAMAMMSCAATPIESSEAVAGAVPAEKFDLSHWNITLPMDANRDGKVDSVSIKAIQNYSHPDFFYLDENDHMVFTAPNKAATTANSSNTRSELRYMLRGNDTRIKTKASGNNFTVA